MRTMAVAASQRGRRSKRAVLPHLNRVYRAALCLAGGQAAAEDLVQETFAQAVAAFGQIEPGADVAAWLYGILVTTFADGSRPGQDELTALPASGAGDWQLSHGGSSGRGRPMSAEIAAVAQLPGADVNHALRELPPDLRIVVYLADVEALGCREIASIITVPPETVPSRLRRGRRQLGELLRDYAATRGLATPSCPRPEEDDE